MMMASENNKHGRPATILVVDDDDDVRAVAVAALSERFNVIEAEGGKEALDVLAEEDVDVVVTDVAMPGISGFHVARGAQDRRPPVKVLMMSAYSAGLVDAALPASGFLAKPFRLRELESAVERLLDD